MKVHPCPRSHTQEICAATGSYLCTSCVKEVERNLRALPGLYQECLHRATSTPRRTNPTRVSGSRTRDHLDVSALDARLNILALLESWACMVAEKLDTAAPPRSVPQLAHFLTRHLPWLAAQPPAADFANEVDGLVGELRQVVDPEPAERLTLIRKCVVDDCAGTIAAAPRSGRAAGAGSLRCSSGHSWEMREWLGLGELMKLQREGVSA
ncbi:hypothetical protein ABZZ79_36660 [Streptomyces sp. NPDC006458]|uniref:hypothetical protein n=1 Tax=Streptomyces sp. NPDC006458 TaxID=3154302 RepID=UPI0033A1AB62